MLKLLDNELDLVESSGIVLVSCPDCFDLAIVIFQLFQGDFQQAHDDASHFCLLFGKVELDQRLGH